METAFVIGGGGFIGRHLVRHLAAHGLRVVATFRPGAAAPTAPDVEWVQSDLASEDATHNWPCRYDAVVYLAQAARWRDFPAAASDIVHVNVCALQQAAEHARHAGANRFVHLSTGTVYSQTREPAREEEPIGPEARRSFYAATKLAAELLLSPYSDFFGLTQLRLFMPYGSGQNERMLLPTIVTKVRSATPVDLHGTDGLRCNPVAVGDVAETVRRCLALDGPHTLNVAGPDVLTLRQVAETIGATVGREARFHLKSVPPPVIVGDTSRLKATLGWQPPTRFVDGVREWLVEKPAAQAMA
jgi:nucleoside-diphosphate-sugar epimerase